MAKGVPKGIDTEKYKYYTLYINTGSMLTSEDYKTKAEAEERKKDFESSGRENWKLDVLPNSNYAEPDYSNKEAYTTKTAEKIKELDEQVR